MIKLPKRKTIYIGGRFDETLSHRFAVLAINKGISRQEALRRLLVSAILSNNIPGIDEMVLDDTRREIEKGNVPPTFTYDPESEPQPTNKP